MVTRLRREWSTRERRVENLLTPHQRLGIKAFRVGGVIALLQESPEAVWQFMFARLDAPSGGALAQVGREPRGTKVAFGYPVDIVGITRRGLAWYLDSAAGRIVSQDMGGFRTDVAQVGRGGVHSACSVGDTAVIFVSDSSPGNVFVQRIVEPYSLRSAPIPILSQDTSGPTWADYRLSGSMRGPCVLWAPGSSEMAVMSTPSPRTLTIRREVHAVIPWYTATARRLRGLSLPVVLDVASFPGGVAVLLPGRSLYQGAQVDVYTSDGAPQSTLLLDRAVLRIAGGYGRLFALSQSADSVFLESYILPASVREGLSPAVDSIFIPNPSVKSGPP